MTYEWSDWSKPDDVPPSPYVAWWLKRPQTRSDEVSLTSPKVPETLKDIIVPQDHNLGGLTPAESFLREFASRPVPLRTKAANPDFWVNVAKNMGSDGKPDLAGIWQPNIAQKDIPILPANAVILGVIDRGIPLHHSRLRDKTGSRIIAAWQQDAVWQKDQPFLPMGNEVYQSQINAAITAHGGNEITNEDALNREFGLLDMSGVKSPRAAALRQSHGAAVLDVAAGRSKDGDMADNVYVIVVNLPDRQTIGLSGAFLDYFTALAIYRIATLADWIWTASKATWANDAQPAENQNGFPIVANLSFGKNAGTKQGDEFFHNMISSLRDSRPKGAPLHLAIPAGNDNLAEGHAMLPLPAGTQFDGVTWMVPPEDQSQNFVEMWTSPIPQEDLDKISIRVDLPGVGQPLVTPSPKIDAVQYLFKTGDKVPRAALYLRKFKQRGTANDWRLQFTLCTLPTLDQDDITATVPSGEWRISLSNESPHNVSVDMWVQTDQSTLPNGSQGLRSFFTDPTYQRYDATGRAIDSYAYPFDAPTVSMDSADHITRHASLNSTASARGTIIAAGHRVSDGRPARYSATGPFHGQDWQNPTASFPASAGAVHHGVLAAGSRDGSVIPISGTSFASAQISRAVVNELADVVASASDAHAIDSFNPREWLSARAAQIDPAHPSFLPKPKVGAGRLPWPEPYRQGRRIWGA